MLVMKTNTITAGAVLRLTQESDIAFCPSEGSAAQAFRQILLSPGWRTAR